MLKRIINLETLLEYNFKDKELLKQALSHSSYVKNKTSKLSSNERLEFLGDRVLGLAIAHYLYKVFNNKEEGVLAIAIAYLNSKDTLYKVAKDLKLKDYIFSSGVKKGKSLKGIYANALEALLGAIYLDGGFESVKKIIIKLWEPYTKESLNNEVKLSFNPKSILQEWTQQNNLPLPIYKDKKKEGTEHAPVFTVILNIKGYEDIVAKSGSKREAQKIAAYNFIIKNNIVKNNKV